MRFQAFLDSIVSDDLRRIARQWHAGRGSRLMPAWKDFDPVPIGPQLRYIWAWKYDRAAGTFVGRLAGEDILTMFGKPMHGQRMEDFFAPEIYRMFLPWSERVVLEPAFAHGSGLIYRKLGRNFTGERIMMPVADDGIHGDGLIGASFYNPVAGEDFSDGAYLTGDDRVEFFPLDPSVV